MKAYFLAALAGLLALPAYAAPNCAPRDAANDILTDMYGESRFASALSDSCHVLEMWSNPATGTWTALAVTPECMACIVDQGLAIQITPQDEAM